jgi:ADP-ribose pyrophosphatase YjhB (NUDIX family)
MSYKNPLPVAVALIPVKGGGLIGVRRGIEPRKGTVALPGGFIEVGESWQAACAREAFEEIQIEIDPNEISVHTVLSAPDGTVLIMGLTAEVDLDALPEFVPNDEALERTIIQNQDDLELSFPLHTEAAKLYFSKG